MNIGKILRLAGKTILIVLVLLLAGVLIYMLRPATGVGVWKEHLAQTATAEILPDGEITIHNVRDWQYEGKEVVKKDWRDITYDPSKVSKMWFLVEPFAYWSKVGHTFITFEFEDGETVSFSIEARIKEGDSYKASRGLVNAYELQFQWGTERDFITRRLFYLGNELHMYPLKVSASEARAIFEEFVAETNNLREHPRHYNTLTENCTNILATYVNKLKKGALPWNSAWYLTGKADEYLMQNGYIELENNSIENTVSASDLRQHIKDIESFATSTPLEFSTKLRALLEM